MGSGLKIERWAFWSPESQLPTEWREHWRAGASAPSPCEVPDGEIPASHRRRMSALSKLAVQIALRAGRGARADFLVFCSQHGEIVRSRELLGSLASGMELSPTSFSQSVHNTSAGLYTIISKSRVPATALASGANTFVYGWLEAEAYLAENARARVLLVSYDDRLPAEYQPYSEQKQCMYALGLVLSAAADGGIDLQRIPAEIEEPLPMAPLFIAWWLSPERTLRLAADGQGWVFSRDTA